MIALLNLIIEGIAAVVIAILDVLPQTPFSWDFGAMSPYLAYANYFFGLDNIVTVTGAYLSACLLWYGIRWFLRLANYID
jgi:hypothetical protein